MNKIISILIIIIIITALIVLAIYLSGNSGNSGNNNPTPTTTLPPSTTTTPFQYYPYTEDCGLSDSKPCYNDMTCNDGTCMCNTDEDCSLNGECTDGKCICRDPWVGQNCESLQFKESSGEANWGCKENPNQQGTGGPILSDGTPAGCWTSWGGGIIFCDEDKKWHIFASTILPSWKQGCTKMGNSYPTYPEGGLLCFSSNSRLGHGVSDTPTGVFIPVKPNEDQSGFVECTYEESINALEEVTGYAHNVMPLKVPQKWQDRYDYKYIIKIYNGQRLIASNDLISWVAVGWGDNTQNIGFVINPKNGDLYSMDRDGNVKICTSPDLKNWSPVSQLYLNSKQFFNYPEDPNMYIDINGNFHTFWHLIENYPEDNADECENTIVAAHVFMKVEYNDSNEITSYGEWKTLQTPKNSEDNIRNFQPYTNKVFLGNDNFSSHATLERPWVMQDENGKLLFLATATIAIPKCGTCCYNYKGCANCKYCNADFTLIRELKH